MRILETNWILDFEAEFGETTHYATQDGKAVDEDFAEKVFKKIEKIFDGLEDKIDQLDEKRDRSIRRLMILKVQLADHPLPVFFRRIHPGWRV